MGTESKSAAQLLNETKQLSLKENAEKKLIRAKGTGTGVMTGLVAGLMIGYFKKYNLYASAIVGVLAGAAISRVLLDERFFESNISKKDTSDENK